MVKIIHWALVLSLIFNSTSWTYAGKKDEQKELQTVELEQLSQAPQVAPHETHQLLQQLAALDHQNARLRSVENPQWIEDRLRNLGSQDWGTANKVLRHVIDFYQTPPNQRSMGRFDTDVQDPDLREVNTALHELQAYHQAQASGETDDQPTMEPPIFHCFYPPTKPMMIYHGVLLAIEVLWLFGLIGCIEEYCDKGWVLEDDPRESTRCTTTKTGSTYTTTCTHPNICTNYNTGQYEEPHRVFREDKAFQYIGIPEFTFLGAQLAPPILSFTAGSLAYIGKGIAYGFSNLCSSVGGCCKSRKNRKKKKSARSQLKQLEERIKVNGFADQCESISETETHPKNR